MAKEKSYLIALLLSLLLCLSSQVGVAEAKRHTLATTRYSESRYANDIPASPPSSHHYPPVMSTPHSESPKGKGP